MCHQPSHETSLAYRQLDAIFAALPTGVLVLDESGVIRRANPAAVSLLGEPLQGERWRQVIVRCFSPRADDGHEISLHDGRRVQLSTQPLEDQPGQLVFINDLTETRRLQDRLNHMKRLSALGNMAASLAHQIRTPLSAAMLYAANLGNRTLKPESRSQFQQKLMQRLQDLEQQVSDVLLFARSGEAQVVSAVSLDTLLTQAQSAAEAFCEQHACRLTIETPPEPLWLMANANALVGAVSNLIANGQQAGATEISVSAHRQGERVMLRIIDNGRGMTATQQARIFEPFFTTRSQGTGLGLAVVHSVVHSHQGEVSVASAPGEGSCFTLSLPLHMPAAERVGGVA